MAAIDWARALPPRTRWQQITAWPRKYYAICGHHDQGRTSPYFSPGSRVLAIDCMEKARPGTGRETGLVRAGGRAPKAGASGDAWSSCRGLVCPGAREPVRARIGNARKHPVWFLICTLFVTSVPYMTLPPPGEMRARHVGTGNSPRQPADRNSFPATWTGPAGTDLSIVYLLQFGFPRHTWEALCLSSIPTG